MNSIVCLWMCACIVVYVPFSSPISFHLFLYFFVFMLAPRPSPCHLDSRPRRVNGEEWRLALFSILDFSFPTETQAWPQGDRIRRDMISNCELSTKAGCTRRRQKESFWGLSFFCLATCAKLDCWLEHTTHRHTTQQPQKRMKKNENGTSFYGPKIESSSFSHPSTLGEWGGSWSNGHQRITIKRKKGRTREMKRKEKKVQGKGYHFHLSPSLSFTT